MRLHAQPLQSRSKTRADEFEQQMQIDVPALAPLRAAQSEESADAALDGKADREQGADVQLLQAITFQEPVATHRRGVAQFHDTKMAEATFEPWQGVECIALEHFRCA